MRGKNPTSAAIGGLGGLGGLGAGFGLLGGALGMPQNPPYGSLDGDVLYTLRYYRELETKKNRFRMRKRVIKPRNNPPNRIQRRQHGRATAS